jgi:hypothetical protein
VCGSSRLRVCHLEPPPTAGSTPVTSFLASLSLCVSTVMLLSLLLAFAPQQPIAPAAVQESLPRAHSLGFLPRGLTSFGAAASGGWLYVLGGYHGTPHEYSIEGQSTAFLQVNLRDTRDLRMLDDVAPVQGAELVAWRGKLIRAGGLHARNVHGESADLHSSDEVALYDPAEGEWSPLPPLPERRSSHRAVVVGDSLVILGGWTLSGSPRSGVWAGEMLSLDLSAPEKGWVASEVPFKRRAMGAAAAGDDLVVVGGIGPDRSIASSAWRLDGATGVWSAGPDFPDWGFGVAATTEGEAVVASGRSGTLFRWGAGADAWRPIGALRQARFFHELVHDRSAGFVALGGITGMDARGRIRPIECLPERPLSPTVERFQLPAPTSAVGGGILADGRSVYFAGAGEATQGQADAAELWRLDLPGLAWHRLADLPERVQGADFTRYGDEALALLAGSAPGAALPAKGPAGDSAGDSVEDPTQGPAAAHAVPASFVYDLEFDDWAPGPALHDRQAGFRLVEHGDALWLFGGGFPVGDAVEEAGRDRRAPLSIGRCAAGGEGFEPSGAELPAPRRDFAAALIGDRYYLVGGVGEDGAVLEDALCFDFPSRAWIPCASPPSARVGAELVQVGEVAFLVGGQGPAETPGTLVPCRGVERFDPATGRWTEFIGDLGTGTREVAAFEVDGSLNVLALGPRSVEVFHIHVH